jgi:hypothetical protein
VFTKNAVCGITPAWPPGGAVAATGTDSLRLVPDEPDQVPRLEQFRAEHPEVIILVRGGLPKAWLGGRKIARHTLRDLLDELEQVFSPDAAGGKREASGA